MYTTIHTFVYVLVTTRSLCRIALYTALRALGSRAVNTIRHSEHVVSGLSQNSCLENTPYI